ncbi:MAG: SixA phosphatase family protein [Gammaproteobacteria bacterium]
MSEQKNPRELLILRHAKSAWDTDAVMDHDRPLAKRGKRDAKRIGKWLREQKIVPDSILSSPARRAVQTTHAICETLHIDTGRVVWDQRIYAAAAGSLLDIVRERPERERIVLLVGHNPGLEHLILYLCGDAVEIPENGKLLPTAALARLAVTREWNALSEGSVALRSITRPGSRPD